MSGGAAAVATEVAVDGEAVAAVPRASNAAATRATARDRGPGASASEEQAEAAGQEAAPVDVVDIEAIKQLIRDVPDFPEPGIVFKDITPVLADPIAFSTIIDLIVVHFGRGNVDKVVGIEARGFILAAPVAYHFGPGVVPVRKAGKLPWQTESEEYSLEYGTATLELHRDAVRPGERVLVVDDVLATGGTAKAAASLVERIGGKVCGIACLIELGLPARSRQARGSRPLHADPVLIRSSNRHRSSRSRALAARLARRRRAVDSREQVKAEQRRGGLLSRLRPGESGPPSRIEPLLKIVRGYNPKADLKEIQRAYAVAEASHEGQKRISGEDFIEHPIAVATILADLHLDTTTITAALLHDTVEDTDVTVAEIEEDFGEEVARIVDGLTKLERIEFKTREQEQAENVRKMVVAMAGDIRVLLIKLADRLHNMRTLSALAAREAAADRDRDAGDLRAAREPPRRSGDEVGARGSVVQDAAPRAVPRDREPGRGAPQASGRR